MPAPPAHKIEQLAVHQAGGGSVVEFAGRAGMRLRTAYRWAALPSTKARVAELRAEFVAGVAGRLASAGEKAVVTLIDLLDAGTPQDSTKLGAAKALRSSLAAMSAIAELQAQLAALEERVDHVRGH